MAKPINTNHDWAHIYNQWTQIFLKIGPKFNFPSWFQLIYRHQLGYKVNVLPWIWIVTPLQLLHLLWSNHLYPSVTNSSESDFSVSFLLFTHTCYTVLLTAVTEMYHLLSHTSSSDTKLNQEWYWKLLDGKKKLTGNRAFHFECIFQYKPRFFYFDESHLV